ncbi:MAG: LysR family transcriptional regulator [Pseudomonadota bacterium]|jgi:DNA-binding transcriptional LysR family regulator
MDIRELRYFAAVFEARSLTAAARRCFVSQPSISAAVASLEAELGTSLFIRHKKGVSPTAAAEQLHAIARRIIDEADAARQLFRAPIERPTLTLGLMRTLDIPRTIALLKQVTADGRMHLRLVGAADKADGRVIARSMVKPREQFIPLWTDRYVAVLPPSHPLTLKERLRTTDLADVPLVDRCHCEQSAFFRRGRRRQPAAAIAESEDWAMALVAAGVGIAIVPEGAARARPDVAVRDIADVDVTRQVGLAYDAAQAPSAALQHVIGIVAPARKTRRRAAA